MNPFLPILAVFTGALLLGSSLVYSLRERHNIPAEILPKWFFLGGLMSFFLVGYLFFLFIQIRNISFPLENLTAAIFFGGSLFVLLITRICLTTLKQVNKQRQHLAATNRQLSENNAILAEEITLRKEAEKRATSRLQYLTSLHAIDTIISASLDLRVTLKVFLDQLAPQLNIDAAAVLLFNSHNQSVTFAAGKGFKTKAIEQSQERLGEGSAGKAALNRKMCQIPQLSADPSLFQRYALLKEEGFVSYCAQPLVAKGEIKGVLEIYHRSTFNPDTEWAEYL